MPAVKKEKCFFSEKMIIVRKISAKNNPAGREKRYMIFKK